VVRECNRGGGSDMEAKVVLLDPKRITVRTILTYDEVDLLCTLGYFRGAIFPKAWETDY